MKNKTRLRKTTKASKISKYTLVQSSVWHEVCSLKSKHLTVLSSEQEIKE